MSISPGNVRDAIIGFLRNHESDASVELISKAVLTQVPDARPSSIRSYLNLNTPAIFARTTRGHYRLVDSRPTIKPKIRTFPSLRIDKAALYQADCLSWLSQQESNSIHAVVTDPPYGGKEYSREEQIKLRSGKGGVWRVPPSFDGHKRSPLPRFTVLDDADKKNLEVFFKNFGDLFISRSSPRCKSCNCK